MAERAAGEQRGSVGKMAVEKKRRALIRKWENTPSPNPEFEGVTPKQMARKAAQDPYGRAMIAWGSPGVTWSP